MHSIGVFLGKKSEVDADSKITKKLDLGSDIVKLFAHNVSRLGEGQKLIVQMFKISTNESR